MAEEVIPKKTGVERQAEILVAALERASQNGGVLLNEKEKLAPHFYNKKLTISPVNALVMAMHSDQGEFQTNGYTLYNETQSRNEAVKKGQKGMPFVWVNMNQYVNKENPEDKLSRSEFKKLPEDAKEKYKLNPRQDTYTIFNIDQTTMSHVHKEEYGKQLCEKGFYENRIAPENIEKDEKQVRIDVNKFLKSIKDNLLPIRKDATGIAHYDAGKDTLYMPAQKDFPSYADYVQEVSRQIAHATGVPQRLHRDGMNVGDSLTEASQREMLVEELTSAHKMLELGMVAKLRPETQKELPAIIAQLKENPKVAEKVFHDVNRTVGMIKKAEAGEKITLIEKPSTEERKQQWKSQFPIDKVPQVFEQTTMLKDDEGKWTLVAKPENERTFAVHPTKEDVGMYFDVIKNDHEESHVQEFRTQFAQKYYSEVAKHPEKEVQLFRSNANQETLDLINKVNAFKTKDSKMLLVATIGGDKQKPVEITQSQWQRMWLADDKQDYKTHLAAILYSDVLSGKLEQTKRSVSPEVEGTQLHEEQEHREYHEKIDRQQQSPEQKEKERREEKAKEEATKQETKAVATLVVPPILTQYGELKGKHPDAMLLFRVGDFYEAYMEDAQKASKILSLTLEKSKDKQGLDGKPLESIAFPHHALDSYLPKLIRAGERIAICDTLPEPKQKKLDIPKEESRESKQEVKEVVEKETRHGMHR